MADPSLVRFRSVVESALGALEARREEVNLLNVFPVADGDTGDNMALTLRAVLNELDRLAAAAEDRTLDDIGRSEIVDSVARAALLGARGNSGVILSQLIRGAAEELISRPGELVDPVLIGAALARAADQAYASVRNPAEGTILTVVREMAHRVASELAHMPETRVEPESATEVQDALLAEVLLPALQAGEESVKRGPDLLPVLREAGVVDAGGHALTVILAGVVAALQGTEAPAPEYFTPARITHPQHESSTFRYCTNFAVTGEDLEARGFHAPLDELGDSVLVVGDRTTLKVHVHTDDPDVATALFAAAGTVSHLDVADMRKQAEARLDRLAAEASAARSGALAVVSGAGVRELFEGVGVHTLDGGPTLNPSTYDLLAGIHSVPAEEVIVLPGSPNVIMAAERAAELSEKLVYVVPTRSQQAGLAVAFRLDRARSAEENAQALSEALDRVRTGAVAPAARDDGRGRFARGDAVGFLGEEIVVWGSPEAALGEVLAQLAPGAELITCIVGAEAPLDDEAVRRLLPNGAVEFELAAGGQPSYWWLLTAE